MTPTTLFARALTGFAMLSVASCASVQEAPSYAPGAAPGAGPSAGSRAAPHAAAHAAAHAALSARTAGETVAADATIQACPVMGATDKPTETLSMTNDDWWPNRLNLILRTLVLCFIVLVLTILEVVF
jgi:hypothetical protein